jgi:hypothetical protein
VTRISLSSTPAILGTAERVSLHDQSEKTGALLAAVTSGRTSYSRVLHLDHQSHSCTKLIYTPLDKIRKHLPVLTPVFRFLFTLFVP